MSNTQTMPVSTPVKFSAKNKNHFGIEIRSIAHYGPELREAAEEEGTFYVRGQNGETMHIADPAEAWEHFYGDNGYRISWIIGDNEYVMRRSEEEQRSDVIIFS